jgi:hypothetical protein
MYYIMRLISGGEGSRVDRIEANSIEEATYFFIGRKQVDEETFHKLYTVEADDSDRRK